MYLSWSKRLVLIVGSAWVAAGGCSVPWQTSALTSDDMSATATAAGTASDVFEPAHPIAANSHTNGHAAEPELTNVLDTLQQVRKMDPAAEQLLIARLRESPATSWPLVAEQFRTSLAYREQMASRQQVSSATKYPVGRGGDSHLAAAGISSEQQLQGGGDRPSTPIGGLTDPRSAGPDGVSSESMARATPYSTPVPTGVPGAGLSSNGFSAPREFASDGPAYPLAEASSETARPSTPGSTDSVVQASYSALSKDAIGANAWQQPIKLAADELSQNIPASPTTTAEVHQLVTLRILHLLSGNTEQALEAIPHLSPTEQDYWSRQLFALATYLDHHAQPEDKRRAAATALHLDEAVSSLRELGTLSLRNFSFCKNVYGYGAIEPYDADRFSPGEQVSLYVEVENYHSRSTEKGYCTSLGSTYEILNEQHERVGGGAMPDVDDCCRSRRRDFHIQYGIVLPKTLAPGKYDLKLIVKDRQSDKIGHASVAFEILGSGT
jgi:hypothetical protein